MTSPSRRRLLSAVLLGVPLLLAAWVGWQAWQLNADLAAAVDDADELQTALRVGDPAAALNASDAFREHTRSASDRTSGVTWSALGRLPVLGDDVRGLGLVSDVLADLADDGVAPLADRATDLTSMAPVDGRVDIARIEGLQAPVAEARASFEVADERLAARDSSSFVGPFRGRYDELAEQVARATDVLDTADRALQVLPTMLGRDGPKNYLLVFQNNAELRATGGLPGAISVVSADDGELSLNRQATAVDLGEAPEPVLPLTPAEREIYGPQLGTYFLDANFTPSFPRAAELMRARWEQTFDERVDGVIAVDPVAVSYLLGATGSVTVGPTRLTQANVVDNLVHQIYALVDDTDEQDELFKLAARTVFDKVVDGGAPPQGVLEALARGGSEHRLLVHSFDDAVQEQILTSVVAGAHTDPAADGPQVGLYLNDNTGAKMSYFLRTVASAEATSCTDGVQTVAGVVRFASEAPLDAATSLPTYVTGGGRYGIDPGYQVVALRLYGPVGGTIDEVTLDGEVVKRPEIVDHDGRPVTTLYPFLGPQESSEIGWTVTSGAGQAGDVALSVTPGIEPRDHSATVATAC
jgi:hypothetical protein